MEEEQSRVCLGHAHSTTIIQPDIRLLIDTRTHRHSATIVIIIIGGEPNDDDNNNGGGAAAAEPLASASASRNLARSLSTYKIPTRIQQRHTHTPTHTNNNSRPRCHQHAVSLSLLRHICYLSIYILHREGGRGYHLSRPIQ